MSEMALSNTRPFGRFVGLLGVGLVVANGIAWLWAWVAFAGHPTLLGTAFLAWIFGLRHAVDADHIAAIDNVVRKLMQQRRQPAAVGLFFSLGHSAVVVAAAVAIAATTAALKDNLEAAYRDMAADESREREAEEWCEALNKDVADASR